MRDSKAVATVQDGSCARLVHAGQVGVDHAGQVGKDIRESANQPMSLAMAYALLFGLDGTL